MDRINSAGVILDPNGHRIRQDMNLQTGAPGTELSSAYDNGLQEELIGGLIEAMGLTPSAQSVRQIQAAIWTMIQRQSSAYAVDGSETANQINIALSPAPIELVDGQPIRFKSANSNSGPTTLTIVGATQSWTVPVVSAAGPLQGGEIVAGCIYDARYNAATENVVIVGYGGGAVPVAPAMQPNQAVALRQLKNINTIGSNSGINSNGATTGQLETSVSLTAPCAGVVFAVGSLNGAWNNTNYFHGLSINGVDVTYDATNMNMTHSWCGPVSAGELVTISSYGGSASGQTVNEFALWLSAVFIPSTANSL